MPFPINLEEMLSSGYVFLRGEPCSECGETVEVFRTPGGRELAMQPMCELLRPAVRHYETCNIAPKQEEQSGNTKDVAGRDSDSGTGGDHQPGGLGHGDGRDALLPGRLHDSGLDDGSPQIKLYGVTDKNMIACGWMDGTLAIQFRHGLYHYSNVPENVFATLRKVPYPNNYFTKVVKSHPELYPYTKLS